jgi:peptidoglycan hydrolase CwlO-like protein
LSTRVSNIGNLVSLNTEKADNCYNAIKKETEETQKLGKMINTIQVIAANNNEKIAIINTKISSLEEKLNQINQKIENNDIFLKENRQL